MSLLEKKYADYLDRMPKDPHGFILADTCDCLLFSCLVGSLKDYTLNVDQCYARHVDLWYRRPNYKDARHVDLWYRRPNYKDQCCPDHSKSSISRDMLLGLAWYSFHKERLDISEGIIKHAKNSFGKMGFSDGSFEGWNRTLISPGLLSTFAWVSYRLGGPSRSTLRKIPPMYGWTAKGYEAHLKVIHGLLRQELEETAEYHGLFLQHASRQPQNPLFAYAAGNRQSATDILLSRSWWPEDRRPSSLDRRGEWLLQRDWGPSWKPSTMQDYPSYQTHTGGDFVFAAGLVLGQI